MLVRRFVEGVSKIESFPPGLEDVTEGLTAPSRGCPRLELAPLAVAGLDSHPIRLFCFFGSFFSWGFGLRGGMGNRESGLGMRMWATKGGNAEEVSAPLDLDASRVY